MSINAQPTFGSRFGNLTSNTVGTAAEDRPKAKFWMNVGYFAAETVPGEDGPRFISLPAGIPLDTTKPLDPKGSNQLYHAMCGAQNSLLSDVVAEAEKLEPGEATYIGDPKTQALVIQIRRVSETPAELPSDQNPFGRPRLVASNAE